MNFWVNQLVSDYMETIYSESFFISNAIVCVLFLHPLAISPEQPAGTSRHSKAEMYTERENFDIIAFCFYIHLWTELLFLLLFFLLKINIFLLFYYHYIRVVLFCFAEKRDFYMLHSS